MAPDPRPSTPPDMRRFRAPLLAWYRREKRPLPWRANRDPYRVWVSEVMLQQTRVDAVVPFFERFLARFPTVTALAAADEEEVLRAWAGLGYYGRARHLHAAAHQIVRLHGGRLPRDPAALAALPGIGPYTAGAIRSIAFDEPAAILDGNVARVLARWLCHEGDPDAPATRRFLWGVAARWASGASPGDANQALMELGAIVCTKPVPACEACPVESVCAARRQRREQVIPRPRIRPATRVVRLTSVLVVERGRLFLVRRRTGRLLRGFWELPTAPGAAGSTPPGAIWRRLGLVPPSGPPVATVRHGILHHAIRLDVLAARRLPRRIRCSATAALPPTSRASPLANLEALDLETRWARAEDLDGMQVATLSRKALAAAAANVPRWARFAAAAGRLTAPAEEA